ncbi:MAG: TetR/AcrR family transcriptional regulator [Ktedonobacteraceae bacterium]
MSEAAPYEPAKRAYHSIIRERQAEESRQHMLEAARRLFLERGYAGTTLDAIAEAAELSPKTITAAFGSKRGILAELLRPTTFGQRFQQLLQQVRSDPDPAQRIAFAAQMSRQAYEAFAPEFDLLRGAATVAPELADLARQIEERRRQSQAQLVDYLVEQGVLRPTLTVAEAVDELWALTGYDIYRMLVVERKWPAERYETWLAELLQLRLLAS